MMFLMVSYFVMCGVTCGVQCLYHIHRKAVYKDHDVPCKVRNLSDEKGIIVLFY